MHGEEAGQYAIDELATSDSNIPTNEELELVTYLLRTSQDETGPSVRAVCEAACRWNDWNLWLQAIAACDSDGPVGLVYAGDWADAEHTFGLDAVQSM
jgi:hypothetical protein